MEEDALIEVVLTPFIPSCSVEDIKPGQIIGVGSFGVVRIATDSDGRVCVMKGLSKHSSVETKQVDHVYNELRVLGRIKHPGIVQLLTYCQDTRNVYLIMEYVGGGELFSHLRKAGRFSIQDAGFYSAQVVLVLEYLRTCSVHLHSL